MSLAPFFDCLYEDVTKKGGVHLIGLKQVGKSNLKKLLTDFVIKSHPKTKVIVIDSEGSWRFNYSKIAYYTILRNTVKISEEVIGQRLNGSNFTKKCYDIEPITKADSLKLIKSKKPILFNIELDNPEEIGFFASWIISEIYDMQRIKRKYNKGELKQSYFIVCEEAENIFDSSSLDKAIFAKFRKKYAEMSNLKIGILSSSQRLTEVNKKFRAKMSGYLFSQISLDDYVGLTERMLKLRLGKDAKKITSKDFRFCFYSTAHDLTVKIPEFKQSGTPYEIPRTKLETVTPRAEPQKRTFKQNLKYLWSCFASFPNPAPEDIKRFIVKSKTQKDRLNNHDNNDSKDLDNFNDSEDLEDESSLIPFAESDEELDEALFS